MLNAKEQAHKAKCAAQRLALSSITVRNQCLEDLARLLKQNQDEILSANRLDQAEAEKNGSSSAFIDRLTLNEKRIDDMIVSLRQIIALNDPLNEVISQRVLKSGLQLKQISVPLGVIGIIYEARPNVTIDCSALAIKSGNACLLKAGKEAFNTCKALGVCIQQALIQNHLSADAVQLLEDFSRDNTQLMMECEEIDVLIPRGSARLIQAVKKQAVIPVIETGAGNCHLYIDESADLDMAQRILINAKAQRPSVCNAIECCLIHEAVAEEFFKRASAAIQAAGIEIYGTEAVLKLFPEAALASEEDWETEYLDLRLSVKIVSSCQEAIAHIQKYSTHHSESIISENPQHVKDFFEQLDSAVLYHNASTRFTDGFEFGLGAEIGISTQKLHARGPMGLKALTSWKTLIEGNGQIR